MLRNEILLVLGVSLGMSALYSLLVIIDLQTRPVPLSSQVTAMNTSQAPGRPWLDLAYQLRGALGLVIPALLALHLLRRDRPFAIADIGLDWRRRPWFDIGTGALLAAVIGVPGIGLYLVAHSLGFNTAISASSLPDIWWGVPILVLKAAGNAFLEEVVVVAYLMTRLGDLRWRPWAIIAASALLRGSYHLYQGWGGFVGNAIMGVVFAYFYTRTKRVMPLIIAHTLLDIGAFVGYRYLAGPLGLP